MRAKYVCRNVAHALSITALAHGAKYTARTFARSALDCCFPSNETTGRAVLAGMYSRALGGMFGHPLPTDEDFSLNFRGGGISAVPYRDSGFSETAAGCARVPPEIRCDTVGSLRTMRFAVANLMAVLLRNIWRLVFAREHGPQVIAGNVQPRQRIYQLRPLLIDGGRKQASLELGHSLFGAGQKFFQGDAMGAWHGSDSTAHESLPAVTILRLG